MRRHSLVRPSAFLLAAAATSLSALAQVPGPSLAEVASLAVQRREALAASGAPPSRVYTNRGVAGAVAQNLGVLQTAPDKTAPPASDETRAEDRDGPGQIVAVRGFRGAFAVNYDRIDSSATNGEGMQYDDRLLSPRLFVQASVAIIDPRILTLDIASDLRLDWRDHQSPPVTYGNYGSQSNLKLDAIFLSGRSAPLRLYFERGRSLLAQQRLSMAGAQALPSDLWQRGDQSSKGFAWEVNNRRLPHITALGSVTKRRDFGVFLPGQDNSGEQRRLGLGVNQERRWGRYDFDAAHDAIQTSFPRIGISSRNSVDSLRGSATLTPTSRLSVDLGARTSRYAFTSTKGERRTRGFEGWGSNTGLRWQWTPRWQLVATYAMSTNLAELAVSSPAGADTARDLTSATTQETVPIERRTLYQEAGGLARYTSKTGHTTAVVGARLLSLDALALGQSNLDLLAVAESGVDHSRTVAGLEVSVGADGAFGNATSSRGERDEYHEIGGHLRLARRLGSLHLAADGSLRDTQAPYFHPVGGQSWRANVQLRFEPRPWARIGATAGRSLRLRDLVYQRGEDRSTSYGVSLSGTRYAASIDDLSTDSSAGGFLQLGLLEILRPEELLLTRPDLFGLLWTSRQRSRQASANVTIVRGLDVSARGRVDRRRYPMSYDLDQRAAQFGLTWSVRQLFLEAGWEYLTYRSTLATTTNHRVYVRVRREMVVF